MPPEPSSSAKPRGAHEPKVRAPQSASEAVLQECTALEEELAALRVAYEQYFLGIERLPPARAHEAFKKRLQKLKDSSTRNTAVKFRVQSINSKYLTYERLWTRTLQEIENGTYKRDLLKAKRRAQKSAQTEAPKQKSGPIELTEELSEGDLESALAAAVAAVSKPATPAVPPPAPVVPPVAPAVAPVVPPVTPAVAPVVPPVTPAVAPVVPPVAPAVAPVVPPVAAAGGTPARGMPKVTPPVPPAGGTPSRGLPKVTPPVPPVGAVPPPPPVGVVPPPPPGSAPRTSTGAQPRAAAPVPPPPPPGAVRPPPPPGSAVRATPPPPPAAAPPRPQTASADSALSDEKLRTVYNAYVQAKRRCQEDTSKMSYEDVASRLRKQVSELLKQANASSVEFKVVIKDGKAVLKAVPK